MPNDEWLEQRLANPLPKDHPDHDAFYDATDEELTRVLSGAAEGSGRRCPSRIAHESGAGRVCLVHDDRDRLPHGSPDGVRWSDDDDRLIGGGR